MTYAQLSAAEKAELERRVRREAERLVDEFRGVFSVETIDRYVTESFLQLQSARMLDFVPVFTRRFARERLMAVAQIQGLVAKEMPEVLYVCVQNAGRSQMAAGLTQMLSGGRVHVRSAGSAPGEQINPAVVTVMAELGIDLSQEFPKPLTDDVVQAADAVITMGCGDACPIYPGKRYLDWELDDPAHLDLDGVRRVRDDIRRRVEALLVDLGVTVAEIRAG